MCCSRGTNGGDYDLGPISVDANNVATIPVIGGIGTDSLVLTIFEGTVSTSDGTVIAGSDGGQFDFFFNVLVGDEDGSGSSELDRCVCCVWFQRGWN